MKLRRLGFQQRLGRSNPKKTQVQCQRAMADLGLFAPLGLVSSRATFAAPPVFPVVELAFAEVLYWPHATLAANAPGSSPRKLPHCSGQVQDVFQQDGRGPGTLLFCCHQGMMQRPRIRAKDALTVQVELGAEGLLCRRCLTPCLGSRSQQTYGIFKHLELRKKGSRMLSRFLESFRMRILLKNLVGGEATGSKILDMRSQTLASIHRLFQGCLPLDGDTWVCPAMQQVADQHLRGMVWTGIFSDWPWAHPQHVIRLRIASNTVQLPVELKWPVALWIPSLTSGCELIRTMSLSLAAIVRVRIDRRITVLQRIKHAHIPIPVLIVLMFHVLQQGLQLCWGISRHQHCKLSRQGHQALFLSVEAVRTSPGQRHGCSWGHWTSQASAEVGHGKTAMSLVRVGGVVVRALEAACRKRSHGPEEEVVAVVQTQDVPSRQLLFGSRQERANSLSHFQRQLEAAQGQAGKGKIAQLLCQRTTLGKQSPGPTDSELLARFAPPCSVRVEAGRWAVSTFSHVILPV